MSNDLSNRSTGNQLFHAIALITLIVPLQIYSGFVIQKLWKWFAVPAFNVQEIGIALAIGLAGLIGFLTCQFDYYALDRKVKDAVSDGWKIFVALIFKYSYFLLAGFIVQKFIS